MKIYILLLLCTISYTQSASGPTSDALTPEPIQEVHLHFGGTPVNNSREIHVTPRGFKEVVTFIFKAASTIPVLQNATVNLWETVQKKFGDVRIFNLTGDNTTIVGDISFTRETLDYFVDWGWWWYDVFTADHALKFFNTIYSNIQNNTYSERVARQVADTFKEHASRGVAQEDEKVINTRARRAMELEQEERQRHENEVRYHQHAKKT